MSDRLNKKFEEIFEEIKDHKDSPKQLLKNVYSTFPPEDKTLKKETIVETELNAYLDISLHYKLTIIAITRLNHALNIWINGILPILLEKHSLSRSEWERISNIGDNDENIERKLNNKWLEFYKSKVKTKQIQPEIWSILQANSGE